MADERLEPGEHSAFFTRGTWLRMETYLISKSRDD